MKIKKLTEDVEFQEADSIEDRLTAVETNNIADDIQAGAEEAGIELSDNKAEIEAEKVQQVEKDLFVMVPERYKTGKVTEIESALQDALTSAARNKNVYRKNFPNVLLYGLAGFGKTAVVDSFCKEHGIYPVYLDVSTIAPEKIAGIPYPVKKPDGTYEQQDIVSQIWVDCLEHEYVILVLDEINRAQNKAVVSSLHELINNHQLPVTGVDENGKPVSYKRFPNILFTVGMCNPVSRELYSNGEVNEIGGALMNRFPIKKEVKADKREFFGVISRIYGKILDLNVLLPEDKEIYQGQFDIAEALLKNNKAFQFDDFNKAVQAHKAQRTGFDLRDSLTYRSFTSCLVNCNGTKADFLKWVKYARFLPETELMIENALSNFTDKIGKGNSPFKKDVSPAAAERSAKAAAMIDEILEDFSNNCNI